MNEIPLGVKILQEEKLKNTIMIQIPATGLFLCATHKKKIKKWDITIIDSLGGFKRYIRKNLDTKATKKIIKITISRKNEIVTKKGTLTIEDAKKYFIKLIEGIKSNNKSDIIPNIKL